MQLSFRHTTFSDLRACFTLISDRFAYHGAEDEHLLRLWREVLERRCGESGVVEAADRGRNDRLVGFGLSVFVADEFAQELATGSLPYVGRQVLRRWQRGSSPILAPKDVRSANSTDGLNVLVLHNGIRGSLAVAEQIHVMHYLKDAFVALHRGYRIKNMMSEVYDQHILDFMLATGFTLITDHTKLLQRHPKLLAAPAKRPYLVGVTRDAALQQPQNFVFEITEYTPPRFGFTSGGVELLERALRGETDDGIATGLNVALVTVKKRWEAIYDRVSQVDPAFFGDPKWGVRGDKRGPEKRRRVLAYIQEHPEELRPVQVKR